MTVKTVLSAKGGDVISIEPTATLETAVKTLAKHRIGALLVLGPDRRVIGILSERDIVRVLGEQGADVLAQPLAQVMTHNVVICGQTETVGTIMERMTTGKFRHVPWSASSRSATSSSTACAKWSKSPRHCATISKQREGLARSTRCGRHLAACCFGKWRQGARNPCAVAPRGFKISNVGVKRLVKVR